MRDKDCLDIGARSCFAFIDLLFIYFLLFLFSSLFSLSFSSSLMLPLCSRTYVTPWTSRYLDTFDLASVDLIGDTTLIRMFRWTKLIEKSVVHQGSQGVGRRSADSGRLLLAC